MSSTETIDYSAGETRTYSNGVALVCSVLGHDARGELVVVCAAEGWELLLGLAGFEQVEEEEGA